MNIQSEKEKAEDLKDRLLIWPKDRVCSSRDLSQKHWEIKVLLAAKLKDINTVQ